MDRNPLLGGAAHHHRLFDTSLERTEQVRRRPALGADATARTIHGLDGVVRAAN